jgi:hypothetical protein
MACRFYAGYSTILSRNTSSKRGRAMPRLRIYILLDTLIARSSVGLISLRLSLRKTDIDLLTKDFQQIYRQEHTYVLFK